MSGAESDAQNPVCVYYYTLLHITAYITFICPSHPSSGGCLCFGLEIRGPMRTIPFGYRNGCRNGAHRAIATSCLQPRPRQR